MFFCQINCSTEFSHCSTVKKDFCNGKKSGITIMEVGDCFFAESWVLIIAGASTSTSFYDSQLKKVRYTTMEVKVMDVNFSS